MIFWTATSIVCGALLASALSYLFHQNSIEGVRDLGFPDFFRIQLAVMKVAAIPIILLPQFPGWVKEWAYAGVAFFILTAIVAHSAHNDSIVLHLINIMFLVLLFVSYFYMPK